MRRRIQDILWHRKGKEFLVMMDRHDSVDLNDGSVIRIYTAGLSIILRLRF